MGTTSSRYPHRSPIEEINIPQTSVNPQFIPNPCTSCKSNTRWLSETRTRIATVSRANVKIATDSSTAHARISHLEDAYASLHLQCTDALAQTAHLEQLHTALVTELHTARRTASDVAETAHVVSAKAAQHVTALRRACAQRDTESAAQLARASALAADHAALALELENASETAAIIRNMTKSLRRVRPSEAMRGALHAQKRASRAEAQAAARGAMAASLRARVRELRAANQALGAAHSAADARASRASAARDAVTADVEAVRADAAAADARAAALADHNAVLAADARAKRELEVANVALAEEAAVALDRARRADAAAEAMARAAEDADQMRRRAERAERVARERSAGAERAAHLEAVTQRLRARCAVLEARFASQGVGQGAAQVATSDEEEGARQPQLCVIDLETIADGEVVIRLPCMHVFHRDCILPYLQQLGSPCCPIDRTPVDSEELDALPVWMWNCNDTS